MHQNRSLSRRTYPKRRRLKHIWIESFSYVLQLAILPFLSTSNIKGLILIPEVFLPAESFIQLQDLSQVIKLPFIRGSGYKNTLDNTW